MYMKEATQNSLSQEKNHQRGIPHMYMKEATQNSLSQQREPSAWYSSHVLERSYSK
jgi:hypothetical protein